MGQRKKSSQAALTGVGTAAGELLNIKYRIMNIEYRAGTRSGSSNVCETFRITRRAGFVNVAGQPMPLLQAAGA